MAETHNFNLIMGDKRFKCPEGANNLKFFFKIANLMNGKNLRHPLAIFTTQLFINKFCACGKQKKRKIILSNNKFS